MGSGRSDVDAGTCLTEGVTPDRVAKAWRVVNSCETAGQAEVALRYLALLAEAYPEVDVTPLQRELKTLFDLR